MSLKTPDSVTTSSSRVANATAVAMTINVRRSRKRKLSTPKHLLNRMPIRKNAFR
ncbi:hypothetical protein D3C76_1850660 [compost metagenome]